MVENDNIRLIEISKGMTAIVGVEDFDKVDEWKWKFHFAGYACRSINLPRVNGKKKYKNVYMHRFIIDAPSHLQVDHINGNRLDNRRVNLRLCTVSENLRNQRKTRGASSYKGVS